MTEIPWMPLPSFLFPFPPISSIPTLAVVVVTGCWSLTVAYQNSKMSSFSPSLSRSVKIHLIYFRLCIGVVDLVLA